MVSGEDDSKGRLYKLIGAVNNGGSNEQQHHYHHDDDYHHRCNCVGAPGPPGPQGTPGIPGIPGRNGNINPIGNGNRNDNFYDYNRRYNDNDRAFPSYRDDRPSRDYDYREDRRSIAPPRRERDYDRYDVPLHPNAVAHQDIRIPEDAAEGRSLSQKRNLVSNKNNPFVTYV